MLRYGRGANSGVAPFAICRAAGCVIAVMAVTLGGCSSKAPEEQTSQSNIAADAQRSRYMEACTKEEAFRKDKRTQLTVCECVFEVARKRLNDQQMEMFIAVRARDKSKQAEIRSQSGYSEASFKANSSGFGQDTVACISAKGTQ